MRVVHASHGKFHHYDLARQLNARGMLVRFFTGYPRWKLRHEDLPHDRISTFPWVETPYMALVKSGLMQDRLELYATRFLMLSFDRYVADRMPDCEAFIGLSGAGLRAGRTVQRQGGVYICDRGSSHIIVQDQLLREEYERQGHGYRGVDPWVIEREQAEYGQADIITVPSEFVRQTFLAQGVPNEKIVKIPYGVNLQRFNKVAEPPSDAFEVVFVGTVSFRKGVPDLLDAFSRVSHPRKRLTVVGTMSREISTYLAKCPAPENVVFRGHCPQPRLKNILSQAHVMVLPSIEEGLALVMAQALACGCPVIATEHTGARDLLEDGEQGFIVPIRNPEAITHCLQRLADEPDLQRRMSEAALRRVRDDLGGWDLYGEQMVGALERLASRKRARIRSEATNSRNAASS